MNCSLCVSAWTSQSQRNPSAELIEPLKVLPNESHSAFIHPPTFLSWNPHTLSGGEGPQGASTLNHRAGTERKGAAWAN